LSTFTYKDFVSNNLCSVPVFRIHEKNVNMAKRRVNVDPSAHNVQLDLHPLCAEFPGENDQRTPDVMSLKDPQVRIS
jgi:hypothetical protein